MRSLYCPRDMHSTSNNITIDDAHQSLIDYLLDSQPSLEMFRLSHKFTILEDHQQRLDCVEQLCATTDILQWSDGVGPVGIRMT